MFGKGLRKSSEEDLLLGRDSISQKGGRLTLNRSKLSNLPIYLFSLFRLPKSVKCKLEKIQRDFLLEGGSLVRKLHLVNGRIVSQGKEKGGMGIRSLDLFFFFFDR